MSTAIGKTNKQIKSGSPQPKDQRKKGRVLRQKCLIESKGCSIWSKHHKSICGPISTPAAKVRGSQDFHGYKAVTWQPNDCWGYKTEVWARVSISSCLPALTETMWRVYTPLLPCENEGIPVSWAVIRKVLMKRQVFITNQHWWPPSSSRNSGSHLRRTNKAFLPLQAILVLPQAYLQLKIPPSNKELSPSQWRPIRELGISQLSGNKLLPTLLPLLEWCQKH